MSETPGDGAGGVDRRAVLGGLVHCASVWSCPKCQARISAERAKIVTAAVSAHRAATATAGVPEGAVYMLTLTVPHELGMRARRLRSTVSKSWQQFATGAPWRRLKERMRFAGSVRALEVTYGVNGFHPHLHILLCLDAPLAIEQLHQLEVDLFVRWATIVTGAGLPCPSWEHGIALTPSYRDDYVSKLGLADELTSATTKSGRGGNRTPLQLMASFARDHERAVGDILVQYHKAMKGARQLTWSRGAQGAEDLRRRYAGAIAAALTPPALPPQLHLAFLTDRELLEREAAAGIPVATLAGRQWDGLSRVMRSLGGDAELEVQLAAEADGARGVHAMLEAAAGAARLRKRLRRYARWLEAPD